MSGGRRDVPVTARSNNHNHRGSNEKPLDQHRVLDERPDARRHTRNAGRQHRLRAVIEHRFRQSELNTWLMCPEQYRLGKADLLPRVESEATALGTAVHHGIETVLRGGSLDDGMDATLAMWDELLPTISWVKATPEACAVHLVNCFESWAQHVWPLLPPIVMVEQQFETLLVDTPERRIWLSGTVDAVTEDGCVIDWKTAASPSAHQPWEAQRFKVQPTVYTYAARTCWDIQAPTFAYCVMLKRTTVTEPLIIEVTRSEGDWGWLARQAVSLALQVEANLPVWQLNDQGWHCSERWCQAWASCKGAHQ
jgi:hypothetical protein